MPCLVREFTLVIARRLATVATAGLMSAAVWIGTFIFGRIVVPELVFGFVFEPRDGQGFTAAETINAVLAVLATILAVVVLIVPRIRVLLLAEGLVVVLVTVLGTVLPPDVAWSAVRDTELPLARGVGMVWLLAIPLIPLYRSLRSPVRRYDVPITPPAPKLTDLGFRL